MDKNIVLCFDNNFLKPVRVLLFSLFTTNSNDKYNIHIVSPDLDAENKEILKADFKDTGYSIFFYQIDDKILSSVPVRAGDYINISTYYRILLPAILPETVDTVLYLDGDMLIVNSISELWNIDLTDKSAAVVPDIHYENENEFKRLGLKKNFGYFNAGFMLINLKYWREHDIQTKTLDYIFNNSDRCMKHDQDALNYTLSDSLIYISTKYNYQRIMYERDFNYPKMIEADLKDSAMEPCIIHYCDREKPWHKECIHPLKLVWIQAAKKLYGTRMKLSHKYTGMMKLKFIIRGFLSQLKIVKPFAVDYTINFSELNVKFCSRFE